MPAPAPAPEQYDIILVGGQSNSIGRANVGTTSDAFSDNTRINDASFNLLYDNDETPSINPKIKMFNLIGGSGLAAANASHIVNASDPIPNAEGYTNVGTIGFPLSFAREYIRNNSSKNVLIIAFGVGNIGFDVTKSTPTGSFWNEGCTLYNNATTRITNAIASLKLFKPNANINIAAFLWHQGEFNEGGTESATAGGTGETNYRSRLLATLKGLRSSALTSLKGSAPTAIEQNDVPILIGGVTISRTGSPQTTTTSTTMRNLLSSFATTNSNDNISYVSSSAIANIRFNNRLVFNHNLIEINTGSYNFGGQHFNIPSMMEFGKRYYFYYHRAKNGAAANPNLFSGGATQSNLPLGFTEDPVVGGKSFKDILDMTNRKRYSKRQKGGVGDGASSVVDNLDDSLEGVQSFSPTLNDFKNAIPPATAAQYRSRKSDALDYLSNTEIVNELKTCLASKSSTQLLTTDVGRDANTTDDNSSTGRDSAPGRPGVNRFTELVNCLRARLLSYAATNELNDAQITKPAYPDGSNGICTYTKFSDPPDNTVIENQIRRKCSDTSSLPTGFAPYSVPISGGKRKYLRRSKKNRRISKKNRRTTQRLR